MARIKKQLEEIYEKPKITRDDILSFEKKLEEFRPQKRMQGILVSPFKQWCLFSQILEIKDSEFRIIDTTQYHYWSDIEEKRKWYFTKEMPVISIDSRPDGLIKKAPTIIKEDEYSEIPF